LQKHTATKAPLVREPGSFEDQPAHPVRKMLPPSSHSTRWLPPGETISTSRNAPPKDAAATAAPQAPC
jgi:hypothetical protein